MERKWISILILSEMRVSFIVWQFTPTWIQIQEPHPNLWVCINKNTINKPSIIHQHNTFITSRNDFKKCKKSIEYFDVKLALDYSQGIISLLFMVGEKLLNINTICFPPWTMCCRFFVLFFLGTKQDLIVCSVVT